MKEHIDTTVHKKDKVDFLEVVRIQQIKKIGNNEEIDTMKDEKYVKKLGAEILNKNHFFYSFNVAVTLQVQDQKEGLQRYMVIKCLKK